MAFVSSQQARLLVGSFAYAAYTKSFTSTSTTDMLDVSTIGASSKQYIVGPTTSTSSFSVLYDATSESHSASWKSSSPQPITFMPAGVALLAETFMANAINTEFGLQASYADAVAGSISTMNTGPDDVGVVIATLEAITATGNGTSVDNGASSANGAVAHLHVTDFSGLTSDTITLEHSANNSTWTTLGTFDAVTAATSQRLTVTGTVNRYVRVVDTVVGTGSVTRLVSLSRR